MSDKTQLVTAESALKGSSTPITISEPHYVNNRSLTAPPASDEKQILFAMGCFWGAERLFWQLEGVQSTSVGYSGGYTENPSYQQVCTGLTGHTEVVRVVYKPTGISLEELLTLFWQQHDPTQGMRQGNDIGSQYRSAIYTYDQASLEQAGNSLIKYQTALSSQGRGKITTEIKMASHYYLAESYHQQYLAKNPNGYCGIGGTGVCYPPQS